MFFRFQQFCQMFQILENSVSYIAGYFAIKPETVSIDGGNSIDYLKENSILGQFFLREKNVHGFFLPYVEILSYQGTFQSRWISYSTFFDVHNASCSS